LITPVEYLNCRRIDSPMDPKKGHAKVEGDLDDAL